ncbi:MAG: flagellar basal body P-ring formation protein FlgA [Gammaproteobacteria bacterium]|nr:flagellar basal body P-ring formation protein FlgA [Gammaproteobacteria bacterium]
MRRRSTTFPAAAAFAAACLAAGNAAADPVHERIRSLAEARALDTARAFAPDGARVEVAAARLDPRLRLAECAVEPETFDAPGQRPGAHLSIGVRCPAAPAWSLYVPVTVDVTVDVVVLGSAVGRGETLRAADLRREPRNVSRLAGGYLTRLEDAEGMVLRHTVPAGSVLAARFIERPTLVERGQRVRLITRSGNISVRSDGEALANAAEGDRVRVRNLSSRTVVEGVVGADGAVHTGG